MASRNNDRDMSITITSFYMKVSGFWPASNYAEHRRRMFTMFHSVCAVVLAIFIAVRDLYFTWEDPSVKIYAMCNVLTVLLVLFKIFVLLAHKEDFLALINYAKTNFWHSNYDTHEQMVMDTCKRTCTYLICFFTFFAQGTVVFYVVRPIISNVGQNNSERQLPCNLWIDKLSITPYYEIAFFVEVCTLYYVGVCYLCFDNFLCIINLHTAGQFRILQYRLANLNCANDERKYRETSRKSSLRAHKYETFRGLVRQHQRLIEYCKMLEKIFTLIVLAQVTSFSVLMCLDGYLVINDKSSFMERFNFMFHIMGCMVQLLMFTYSCDQLIRESMEISNAAYRTLWEQLPMDKHGKMLRKDLQFVIMRSKTPCCLTGSGFFVVKLETYTGILSTAVSYFTLLRQQVDK